MGKPMTEEAKVRLRELAAKKKAETAGRNTLIGLDGGGWMAALDALLNDEVRFPRSDLFTPLGEMDARNVSGFRYHWSKAEKRENQTMNDHTHHFVTHVKLNRGRDDQHADLVRCLPAVPVVEWTFVTIGFSEPRPLFLYPVAPMMRLMYAIWPGEKEDWIGKACKYLHGYSLGWLSELSPLRHRAQSPSAKAIWTKTAPAGFIESVEAGTHQNTVAAIKRARKS